uniref:Uncharacterized protein n=1 Tax=Arundo donax TaxID=35708 RepID=A0A0A8Z378_ARUDO
MFQVPMFSVDRCIHYKTNDMQHASTRINSLANVLS